MEKLHLTKKYKPYFSANTKPELITIDPASYLSICGKGDPSGPTFANHIEALYATAYTVKFAYKGMGKDFVVSKLEGLWWFDEEKHAGKTIANTAIEVPRSEWEYRLLIRMPEYVVEEEIHKAIEAVVVKKNLMLAREVAYYVMSEGKCVQMMHVGPFSTEPESLQQIAVFMDARGLGRNGYHHEIYLSDFRKTEPAKLKTILREPVK